MRPSEFKAIKALAEVLRAELTALRQVGAEQVSAIRDAKETAEKNWADIPRRTIAAIQPTEASQSEDRAYRHKNYAVQVILMFATVGAFLAAAIYAGFAYRTLKEIQKQTPEIQKSADAANSAAITAKQSADLMRHQSEDSEEAICSILPTTPDLGAPNGQDVIQLVMRNTGKRTAHNVSAHIEISFRRFPDTSKVIGKPEVRDVYRAEVFPAGRNNALDFVSTSFEFKPILTENKLYLNTEAVFQISVVIHYENGFGDWRDVPFGQDTITHVNDAGVRSSEGVDCDDLGRYVRDWGKK